MNKEAIYKRLVEGAIKNKLVDAGVEYGDFLGVIVLPPGKSSSFDRKVYANWEAAFNAIIKPVLVHDIVKLNMAPSEITWAENDLRCLSTWDDDVKKLLDIMYETTDWEPYEEPELIGFEIHSKHCNRSNRSRKNDRKYCFCYYKSGFFHNIPLLYFTNS